MTKIFCLIIYLLFIFLVNSKVVYDWTPHTLSNVESKSRICNLYDPENYIQSYGNIEDISYLCREINHEKDFNIYIYIISSYSKNYRDIEIFTNELAIHKIGRFSNSTDENTIFFVLSIDDRQNRLRTGSSVRHHISDYQALQLLNDLRPKLRSREYAGAIVHLLNSLKNHHKIFSNNSNENSSDGESGMTIFMVIIMLFLLFIPFLIYSAYATKKVRESKLSKIHKFVMENQNFPELSTKICVICLDDMNPDSINKDIKNEVKEFGDCGHVLHSECIKRWMKYDKKCPVCIEHKNYLLSEILVNIQKKIDLNMNRLIFVHNTSSFSWSEPIEERRRNNYRSYENSYSDTSNSNDSGGSSSSW